MSEVILNVSFHQYRVFSFQSVIFVYAHIVIVCDDFFDSFLIFIVSWKRLNVWKLTVIMTVENTVYFDNTAGSVGLTVKQQVPSLEYIRCL